MSRIFVLKTCCWTKSSRFPLPFTPSSLSDTNCELQVNNIVRSWELGQVGNWSVRNMPCWAQSGNCVLCLLLFRILLNEADSHHFSSLLSWRLFTAQHASGVFPSIIRGSWSGRPARPRAQHDCHHDTKVKPEAATAVIEPLMMGGKTPETCWAVNKRQDNKLENCCIWLVIYLNSNSITRNSLIYGYHVALLIVKCGRGGQAEHNTRHSSRRPQKSSVQDHLYKSVTLRVRFLNPYGTNVIYIYIYIYIYIWSTHSWCF